MAKRTTALLDTWTALHDLLVAQVWPPHETTMAEPEVIFGDAPNYPLEAVIVFGVPARTDTRWATMGAPSRDEDFTLQVSISTRVQGQTRQQVVARLGVLAAVVEDAVRDTSTGRQTGGFEATVPGVLWWGTRGLLPQVVATDEGFVGRFDIDIAFRARI